MLHKMLENNTGGKPSDLPATKMESIENVKAGYSICKVCVKSRKQLERKYEGAGNGYQHTNTQHKVASSE